MSLLKAYLSKSSIQRILSRKPGEKGFSLIELVVVVAVLAILSAIAIPNFLSISDDARVNGVKNTLATLVKECAVKLAQGTTSYAVPDLTSSAYQFADSGTDGTCASSDSYSASPIAGGAAASFPTFTVTAAGVKTCTPSATTPNNLGCNNIVSGTGKW